MLKPLWADSFMSNLEKKFLIGIFIVFVIAVGGIGLMHYSDTHRFNSSWQVPIDLNDREGQYARLKSFADYMNKAQTNWSILILPHTNQIATP